MLYLRNGLVASLMMHASVCLAASCAEGVQLNGEALEFSGVLHREVRWGPPNFGENPETDSKFTAWIISVSMPIPVQGGAQISGKSQPTVSEIQLSFDPTIFHSETLWPLDGKMVVATGKLWNGTSQGDVTPVVLSVRTVKLTDQTICRITREN